MNVRDTPVPRLLPPDPPWFLNRAEEFEAVGGLLRAATADGKPALIWFTGQPGVGKTTLAVWLGHRLADSFPDGQLYYELRGSMPGGAAQATDVLAYFLGRLGKTAAEIPVTEQERAADFRSLTNDKKILVVLDDAHTAAQVRALLPSSAISAVLVTSRRHLDGLVLAGFEEVRVTEFAEEVAAELVARSVDQARLAAEPDALHELITLCGRLPLALTVMATRVAVRRRRPLSSFVAMFAGTALSRLQIDGAAPVEAVFDACYDDLVPDQQAAYRLLGLHPGPHFSISCAAALLDVPPGEALEVLDALADAYLLQDTGDGRYRFHSLIGLHAHARAVANVDPQEQRDATVRVAMWYWHRAVALGQVVSARWTVTDTRVGPAYTGPAARDDAARDLEVEAPNFRAVADIADVLRLDDVVTGLCEALKPWYYDTDRGDDLIALLRLGAPAAQRTANPRLAMRLQHDLGAAHEKLGEFGPALAQFELARDLAERMCDALGEASAIEWEGLVHRQLGDHDRALRCLRNAREIIAVRDVDAVHRERASMLLCLHIGTELTLLNQADAAVAELEPALSWFAGHDEPVNEARALLALGRAHATRPDQLGKAADLLAQAADSFERLGFRSQQAEALTSLAEVRRGLGQRQAALEHARQAIEILQRLGQHARATGLREMVDDLEAG